MGYFHDKYKVRRGRHAHKIMAAADTYLLVRARNFSL
jgi:hypothetical protein